MVSEGKKMRTGVEELSIARPGSYECLTLHSPMAVSASFSLLVHKISQHLWFRDSEQVSQSGLKFAVGGLTADHDAWIVTLVWVSGHSESNGKQFVVAFSFLDIVRGEVRK